MYSPEDLHGWYTVFTATSTTKEERDVQALKEKIKKQEQEIKDLKLIITALEKRERFLLKHVRQSTQGGVKNLK